jgi:hypothetical protein
VDTLTKGRLMWLVLSFAAMFVAACAVFGWLGAVGRISGWTGLPQYQSQIPKQRVQAEVWPALAVALPFLGALFLWLGRQKPGKFSFGFEYGIRLGISILCTLGFSVCLLLIAVLLGKIDLHINHY